MKTFGVVAYFKAHVGIITGKLISFKNHLVKIIQKVIFFQISTLI
jgi:hypothetical protein